MTKTLEIAPRVEEVCKKVVEEQESREACNKFVEAVAKEFGRENACKGLADEILARMRSSADGFVLIGPHPSDATKRATQGKLVLGGLSSTEMNDKNGHIVVIVPGGPSQRTKIYLCDNQERHCRGGYPYCYHGTMKPNIRFRHRTQVDAVFPKEKLDKIVYAYLDVASPTALAVDKPGFVPAVPDATVVRSVHAAKSPLEIRKPAGRGGSTRP